MSAKKIHITHACGHEVDWGRADLRTNRGRRLASEAHQQMLASQPCRECCVAETTDAILALRDPRAAVEMLVGAFPTGLLSWPLQDIPSPSIRDRAYEQETAE